MRRPLSIVDIACFAVLLICLAAAFWLKRDGLFLGFDGSYMRNLAARQSAWDLPMAYFTFDMFQGLGDLFFTTNFQLFPANSIGMLFGPTSDQAKIAVYVVSFLELTIAIFLLGRFIELPTTAALAGAFAMPLLAFPLFETGAIYSLLSLVPQTATLIAVVTIMGWAYCGITGSWTGFLWRSAILIGGLVFISLAAVINFLVAAPIMVIYAIAGLAISNSRRETLFKIALLILAVLVMLAGPVWFFLGLALNSAPAFFPAELENNRVSLLFSTILFHWKLITAAGPIFVVLAIIGAIWALIKDTHPARRVLAWSVLSVVVLIVGGWLLTLLTGGWRGPAPLYFEFYAMPLYSVFAAYTVWQCTSFLPAKLMTRLKPEAALPLLVLGAAVLAIGFAAGTKDRRHHFTFPPHPSNAIRALNGMAQKPGAAFKGRVAVLTGQQIDRPVTWTDLHVIDSKAVAELGNDHRLIGLTYFDLPTLFQYTSSISPGTYAFLSRLLALPEDQQSRSVLVLRRYNEPVLQMLGVAAVITDVELPGTPLATDQIGETRHFTYAIDDPNLGSYSPTEIVPDKSAPEIITAIAAVDFDPKTTIFADLSTTASLVPAHLQKFEIGFDGLKIEAQSSATSILLLPIEFSSCLDLKTDADAQLVRANLVLTGLVFSADVSAVIRLRHGAYTNPSCRLEDRRQMQALDLSAVSVN
ncbi:MAG: hypothetical protein AAF557_11030 [Pseudomonadota bacterium]